MRAERVLDQTGSEILVERVASISSAKIGLMRRGREVTGAPPSGTGILIPGQ